MTTPAAEALYLAQHFYSMEGKPYAIFNPENKPVESLPIIYGFNNGGSEGWYDAQLLAEDGTFLGRHCCSHEGYMRNDLGILEGTRPDRHETFKKHYPQGYRMVFLSYGEVSKCEAFLEAIKLNELKARELSNSQIKENVK